MTAIAALPTAVPRAVDVVALTTVRRRAVFATPLLIVAAVFVVTAILSLALQRFLGSGDAEALDGARQNPAIAWALSGFVVALGVQGAATAFPLSLALGATRRVFTLGTLLTNLVIAAYFTGMFLALLGIELLTGHWFADIHLVDVYLLGAGDVRLMLPIVFLGTLTLLCIGSVFGASHVRFGAVGPSLLGLGSGLVLAIALLVGAPALSAVFAAFQLWWLVVAAVALVLASAAGILGFLRSASVR